MAIVEGAAGPVDAAGEPVAGAVPPSAGTAEPAGATGESAVGRASAPGAGISAPGAGAERSADADGRRSADTGQPVKSADRTLAVLEALAESPGPRGLGDLSRTLDIPKSSLHGILRTMVARGWVRTDPTGTRFGLGIRALRVGAAYLDSDDAGTLLSGVLDELAGRFGEAVHLARLDGGHVVYLAKRDSVHRLRLFSAIGRRLPAHATALGKALLAARADDEVHRLLDWPLAALTPHTITDSARLGDELAATRDRGYAIDREENTEGIVCVAVAVPSRVPPVDALSVSVPAVRLGPDGVEPIAVALLDTVAQLRAAGTLLTPT